jgi:hypothetical protein
MRIVRIYTGDDEQSHLEEFDVPMEPGRYGSLSAQFDALGVIFRETPPGGELDFHNAPRRQFVVTLEGLAEVECGDGSKAQLGAGDILLADDITGQGHITRDIEGPRRSLFIPLPDDFDVDGLRG